MQDTVDETDDPLSGGREMDPELVARYDRDLEQLRYEFALAARIEQQMEECLDAAIANAQDRWGDENDYAFDKVRRALESKRAKWLAAHPSSGRSPKRPPIITTDKRRTIYERDAYRCQMCDGWEDLTIDHIVPRERGGTNDMDNLQTLCRKCNSRKGIR
jgi:hypothetical protein